MGHTITKGRYVNDYEYRSGSTFSKWGFNLGCLVNDVLASFKEMSGLDRDNFSLDDGKNIALVCGGNGLGAKQMGGDRFLCVYAGHSVSI